MFDLKAVEPTPQSKFPKKHKTISDFEKEKYYIYILTSNLIIFSE